MKWPVKTGEISEMTGIDHPSRARKAGRHRKASPARQASRQAAI
jgi:hypothetical protein